MNNKFDALAKGLAQSVTRRQALKRFGTGLAGIVLGCFGVAQAQTTQKGYCVAGLSGGLFGKKAYVYDGYCLDPSTCQYGLSSACQWGQTTDNATAACGTYIANKSCSF